MAKPTLVDVKGIGSITAGKLSAAGIGSVEAILKASPQKIGEVTGFDINRVERILAAAAESLQSSSMGVTAEPVKAPAATAKTQSIQDESSPAEKTGKKSKAKKTKDSEKKKKKKKTGGKKTKKKVKKGRPNKKKDKKKSKKKKKKSKQK